jgi:hypothetical protein
MWRPLISRIARLATLADGTDALDQRLAKRFQLHQFDLLACDHIIEFVQQLVLVSQSRFEIDKAFLAHGGPLFVCAYSGRIHAKSARNLTCHCSVSTTSASNLAIR